jgi:hypothetical protein
LQPDVIALHSPTLDCDADNFAASKVRIGNSLKASINNLAACVISDVGPTGLIPIKVKIKPTCDSMFVAGIYTIEFADSNPSPS